ncbi:MAG: response regulator [Deltaproteobacteria bacterium]|jgi:CheY-like chemotaxis protein|nr:response regulator [Deltaproteobacteria bacterium]
MDTNERMPRVVIAEDDDDMRAVLSELVSSLGTEVAVAASGSELVKLLTDDQPVDLVVTDVRMPWMTGYNVALSARNSGMGVPIIIVTAFPDDELRAQVERLGSAVLLAKPFRPEELLALVRARLPGPRATA